MPDRALALWMLDRMADSEEFLAVIQAARVTGKTDVLDTPDYVATHKARLKKLYTGSDDDEPTEVPAALVGAIEAIIERDMISGVEEFLEKVIAAYVEKHPLHTQGLPQQWRSTFEAARTEIEGKTSGMFAPDFTARLAASARQEIDRQQTAERERAAGRDGRDG
jgi:hypothetical protein